MTMTCSCGCGKETPLAKRTRRAIGHVKGQPVPFLRGHYMPSDRLKHAHTSRDGVSRTYRSWQSMKSRCTNENAANYENYGGRGIEVCPQWLNDFECFLRDMGERPEWADGGINRIDNDSDYTPDNCEWATRSQQQKNTRPRVRNHLGRYMSKSKTQKG